eukprot:scaffold25318_cov117-Isochrysis_galbana.AAC.1
MSISSYDSDSDRSAASQQSTAFASFRWIKPIPSVGHGSARRSRDARDHARRRFVSLRFVFSSDISSVIRHKHAPPANR